MTALARFAAALEALPLVAILRGVVPEQAIGLGQGLQRAGWSIIEVPLNSPQPLRSIEALVRACSSALIGAGTVLSAAQVRDVHAAGAQLVVSPNFDPRVVAAARALDMVCLPGVATPSEAFAALACGASGLKLFPAEMIPPTAVAAWRAVLDPLTLLLPVGGIGLANMAAYRRAGANGFGLGGSVYRPGLAPQVVERQARELAIAWRAAE